MYAPVPYLNMHGAGKSSYAYQIMGLKWLCLISGNGTYSFDGYSC